MEVNKEEALRCLSIAQKHRNAANLPSALKFARKSVSLFTTPEGEKMVQIIETEISVSSSGSGGGSSTSTANGSGSSTPNGNAEAGPSSAGTAGGGKAKASGVEEHISGSARHRPGHSATAAAGSGGGAAGGSAKAEGKKREYTVKQMEVVKRIKSCQGHQYYEILSVERSCTENDVKKAYKKLALALHPDKNGAPGADEAFKMVSKAFQVLSDPNLRAAFDSNPHVDPTQRGGGGGGGFSNFARRGGGGGGGGGGGYGGDGMYTEFNPEDLFNAFFGGGMGMGGGRGGMGAGPFGGGNVFTFGGPGFQTFTTHPGARARQAHAAGAGRAGAGGGGGGNDSPLIALLPVILLCAFALLSALPSLFSSGDTDPAYAFAPSQKYDMGRDTWHWGVRYYVNKEEWGKSGLLESIPEGKRGYMDLVGARGDGAARASGVGKDSAVNAGEGSAEEAGAEGSTATATAAASKPKNADKGDRGGGVYSSKVRTYERAIENVYAQKLRNECDYFTSTIERQIQAEAGFFGLGANYPKIRELRSRKNPACEQLKVWGVNRAGSQNFY